MCEAGSTEGPDDFESVRRGYYGSSKPMEKS